MDPENLMLSKISQTEKDKHIMVSLTCGSRKQNRLTAIVKQIHIQRTNM